MAECSIVSVSSAVGGGVVMLVSCDADVVPVFCVLGAHVVLFSTSWEGSSFSNHVSSGMEVVSVVVFGVVVSSDWTLC